MYNWNMFILSWLSYSRQRQCLQQSQRNEKQRKLWQKMKIYSMMTQIYSLIFHPLNPASVNRKRRLPKTNHCSELMLVRISFKPSTAGPEYLRFLIFPQHTRYHLSNMVKIKCDINRQYLKIINLHSINSLEVVDRVSETQLQVGKDFNWIVRWVKG